MRRIEKGDFAQWPNVHSTIVPMPGSSVPKTYAELWHKSVHFAVEFHADGSRRSNSTAGVVLLESPLFSTYSPGAVKLKNRVVMAPMTRSRAIGNVPNDLMVEYYRQRACAGLLITEGVSPSPNGLGYARIPGMFNGEQVVAWRQVTDAVHAEGAHIFVQFMHTGRVGHPANLPQGARVVAPSPLAAPGEMWTDAHGMQPHPVPDEMTETDIEETLEEFATAARLAVDAGFDGVELHGANGYLIEQFLNVGSNQRTDRWGATVEGRIRFAVEAARRVVDAIGGDRVGMRISPYGTFNGMQTDALTHEVYAALAKALSDLGLVYIHMVDHSAAGAPAPTPEICALVRSTFKGAYILSGGYDAVRADSDLKAGKGDLVAFGKPFISNPNLVQRMQTGEPLAPVDFSTLYTPGPKGYTDYPGA